MKQIEPSKTNQKAAIVCLGTRISLDSNNVRSVDLRYMRDYLLYVLNRDQVDFISRKTKKESGLDYFKDTREVDFNDYDEIYIYNASFNPFGGLFKSEALDTFEKLYDFKGDIIYFLVDPKMPMMDFSRFLKARDKNNEYIFGSDEKEINNKRYIKPEIVDNWTDKVWKRIKVAYGGIDYEKYVNIWNSNLKKAKGTYKELNEDCEWFNFWIFEYYAVNEELDLKLKDYKKIDNPYDLVYFGNNRQNERNKVIKKFYSDPELRKLFIGFDPELPNTDVEKYVKHDELFRILGEKCLATLVVGDNLHNGNERTPRFFEAMLLDIVAFINIDFDPEKRYVKNDFLKEFIYVSTPEELKERIEQIKKDPELYNKIVKLEREEILNEFSYMKHE